MFVSIYSTITQGFEISGTPGSAEFNQSLLNNSAESEQGQEGNFPKVLPTVFKWEGGGKSVHITGTFNQWKTIPMVKRYVVYYY